MKNIRVNYISISILHVKLKSYMINKFIKNIDYNKNILKNINYNKFYHT